MCPMGINLDVGAHPGPMGNLSPHGMVAGHCLAPCDFGSFGLGSLPVAMLLGCWPLSCSSWPYV